MAQRIENVYRIVTFPAFYRGLHAMLGSHAARERYVAEMLRPRAGQRMLDVGCGPGTIVPYLPAVDYTGIDMNPRHIEFAKTAYGDRGTFLRGDVTKMKKPEGEKFDLINVAAILHHIDDDLSKNLLTSLLDLLAPGGRIITSDPVYVPRQRPVAWLFNALDSGKNVRTPEAYLALVDQTQCRVQTKLYNDFFRVPYDHFCMTISRADA